jgi:hypothetical protein
VAEHGVLAGVIARERELQIAVEQVEQVGEVLRARADVLLGLL